MIRTPFNSDWTVGHKGSPFDAFSGGSAKTAVTLPHDGLRDLPRSADSPSGSHTGYYPSAHLEYTKTKAEEGRVSVRNIRRHAKQALDRLEKDGEVGKDDVTGAEKRLDGLTKKHVDAIDDLLLSREWVDVRAS